MTSAVRVAIWTPGGPGKWHPSDIVSRGLGGSETSAFQLARGLVGLGIDVDLIGNFPYGDIVGGVRLRQLHRWDPQTPRNAILYLRDAAQASVPHSAGKIGLWLTDTAPAEGLNPLRADRLDRIFTVSGWHRNQVLQVHPYLADRGKVVASRNGIERSWFRPAKSRARRVVYTSSLDRGAYKLLMLWPQIRGRVPDAELVLTYCRWYDLGVRHGAGGLLFDKKLRLKLGQPGVTRIENGLSQPEVADLLCTSAVWAHPSWYIVNKDDDGVPFLETGCIAAMEAQAAGCVVAAAGWGALTETVKDPTGLIAGPMDEDWDRRFVDRVVDGLTMSGLRDRAAIEGPRAMEGMGWDGPVQQVCDWITGLA